MGFQRGRQSAAAEKSGLSPICNEEETDKRGFESMRNSAVR